MFKGTGGSGVFNISSKSESFSSREAEGVLRSIEVTLGKELSFVEEAGEVGVPVLRVMYFRRKSALISTVICGADMYPVVLIECL